MKINKEIEELASELGIDLTEGYNLEIYNKIICYLRETYSIGTSISIMDGMWSYFINRGGGKWVSQKGFPTFEEAFEDLCLTILKIYRK